MEATDHATLLAIFTPILTAVSAVIIAYFQLQAAKLARKAAEEARATRDIAERSVDASHRNAASIAVVSAQVSAVGKTVNGRVEELKDTLREGLVAKENAAYQQGVLDTSTNSGDTRDKTVRVDKKKE